MRKLRSLAVVLLSGALLSGCGHSAVRPAGFLKTMQIDGATATYVGTEPFSRPISDEANPAVVYVYAGNTGVAHACESTPVAHVQSQTDTSVTVLVARYALQTKGDQTCATSSAGVVRLTVRLAHPLGHRPLLDAGADGVARPVLDPATVPKVLRCPPATATSGCPAGPGRVPQAGIIAVRTQICRSRSGR